jgi:uncharacterized membrane protein YjjP (DUF1212 family)
MTVENQNLNMREMRRNILLSGIPYQIVLFLFALYVGGGFVLFFIILLAGDALYVFVYLTLHKKFILSQNQPNKLAFITALVIFQLGITGLLYAKI